MGKSAWITMLKKDEARARAIYQTVSEYGLGVEGHFWKDDMDAMEWSGAVPEIAKPQTGLWVIVGDTADFTDSVVRGLSLAALSVHAKKNGQVPVMILAGDPAAATAKLPPLLSHAQVFTPDNPALGAKMTAKANLPLKTIGAEYRFNLYALPRIGLWVEAGPVSGEWQGVLFATAGASIDAMGIGPSGSLPERSTLEYPMRDMTLAMGEREYTAWAVRNTVSASESVFARIKGQPDAFLFGPFDPEADDIDAYTLSLH